MKLRKLVPILILLLTFILSMGVTQTYAANSSYILGITNIRESGGAYTIQPNGSVKKIWKIVSYADNTTSTINYDNAFYCIKAEHGFAVNSGTSVTTVRKTYNTSYNMKTQKVDVMERLNRMSVFTVDPTSYNKIMWIIDNMYLPKQEGAQISKEALYNAAFGSDVPESAIRLTDDDIEVIQQLALWYFTNPEDSNYHIVDSNNKPVFPTLYFNNNSGRDTDYKSLEDLYNDPTNNGYEGRYRQEQADMLYKYIVSTAETKGDYVSSDATSPIVLDKSLTTIKQDENNYIIGPIKLDVASNVVYDLQELEILDQNSNEVSYTMTKANNEVVTSIKNVIGEQFYITTPKNNNISKLTINLGGTYVATTATYYTTEGNTYLDEQPVVLVERATKQYLDSINLIAPKIDLALRKSITKINGVVPTTNRLPDVDTTKLAAGESTTATYNHPKNDLLTDTNEYVEYTLNIYNEGNINAYAAEIKDYLPAGIEFVEIVNGADKYEAAVTKNADGTSVVTITNTGKTVLNKYEGGTSLSNEALALRCKITAVAKTEDVRLVNIAEITKYYDAESNIALNEDRDSQIANFPENKKNNQYAGNGAIGNYVLGQQDDDDFEPVILPGKYFDLSLRKFIISVNNKKIENSREPVVDVTPLITGESTTAIYNHPKVPLSVKVGDIITYTVRVYNEGKIDGYAEEITDHLPEYLEFLPEDEENIANGWYYDENDTSLRTIKTSHLSKDTDDDNIIKAFNGKELDYKDITVKCKVKNTAVSGQKITNIADITLFADGDGEKITDRDSQENNVVLPSDEELPYYKDSEIDSGKTYIPGQQDDDDFEKVKVQIFDLALRKFITKIDNKDITNRIPKLSMDENGNIKYTHTKEPLQVQNSDIVTYTLRIFNEGDIDGYAAEITDNLPEGLEFLPENSTNKEYRWKMIDEDGNETSDVSKAVKITTDYLSKDQEKTEGANLIKAFDKELGITDENPDYRDIKVAFKVIEPSTSDRILTNTAEISEDTDKDGEPIDDIDSIPGNNVEDEDDIDVEHVKLVYFDLALRKFITKVNTIDVNNRVPVLSMDENGNIKYTHTKEPVEVEQTDIVTYTIRIFNEGKISGYAKEVTDNIPEGLEFLPENETNKEYRWKMIDENGNETSDVSKAVKITTDYLSKDQEKTEGENLIKAFDKELGITDKNPDYRDVKVAFKVTEPNTSDRIIINVAEISEDSDENGDPVDDIDSIPDNNKDGEDDIDIEKIKVKYFDLALKKWVTSVVIIKNGEQTVTNTGHTGDENPEPVVKVDLKDSDIKKITVKFGYKIKVTNEGQIAGYAKEVKDYIPEGLKFVQEDNPDWKQISDKVVVTNKLENTLLRPGESATVDILLTWENSKDNMGLKVNVAEISKDYNDSGTPDKDSTPDNKKEGEDDIDDAPVILVPKTGEIRIYFVLSSVILIMLAGGVILIKKFVL